MSRQRQCGDLHPKCIAALVRREGKLNAASARLRRRIDQELIAARRSGVSHKEIAYAIQRDRDGPSTAAELVRLEVSVRKRTSIAVRRVMGPHKSTLAGVGAAVNDGNRKEAVMNAPVSPYRRRIVEEWFETPPPSCIPCSDDPHTSPELGDPAELDHEGDE